MAGEDLTAAPEMQPPRRDGDEDEDDGIADTTPSQNNMEKEDEDAEPAYEQVDLNDDAVEHGGTTSPDAEDKDKPQEPEPQAVDNTELQQPGSSTPHQEPNAPSASEHVASPPPATPSAPDTPTSRSVSGATRPRTDSQSTTATTATKSSVRSTRTSMVFVVSALESIAASKDARKRKELGDSAQRALSAIRTAHGDASQIDPEVMFEPLSLASESSTEAVVVSALDCIGKLISYSYFSIAAPSEDVPVDRRRPPLIDRAIDTICDCFQGESTPVNVQMQIIKSLLSAILDEKIVVHGAGLLKSVRQTYNIFLLSKNSANQHIAQGTLMQMVGTVFERVKLRIANKAARAPNGPGLGSLGSPSVYAHSDVSSATAGDETPSVADVQTPDEEKAQPKMTLQTFETRKSFDDARITDSAPTMVTKAKRPRDRPSRTGPGPDIPSITVRDDKQEAVAEDEEEDEIYIKDAFLIFRAMCKLSTKALRVEDAVDVKSQGMRSKLLSLHIIHTVLFNHFVVFTSPHATIRSSSNTDPTAFTQAVKQYLCLSLSRNGASSINKVFEVSAEIFSLMMKHLRSQLKRELEVFLKEIYITILDKRNAPHWQKSYIVQHIFGRIGSDPRTLVEIYLNYDCDRQALDNMYQRMIEHVSKMASQPVTINGLQEQAYADAASKQNSASNDWRERGTMPPSLTTASMSSSHDTDQAYPPEYAMKMQSLECLLDTLRSMVNWSQEARAEASSSTLADTDSRLSLEGQRESMDTRLAGESADVHPATPRLADTPLPEDDPEELEKVKQKKTALNNAVRAFNFKPKKGIKSLIKEGFIASSDPRDIAAFFSGNERIDKKSLGEFLGEGDEDNIKIMHAFVDNMDFSRTRFVDALRRFLQSFRLPGEAQKIDRLMLKFAERYLTGNPAAFANADTAYVLAYSVIMLNTDQHSAQVKKRMTVEDFIKNNRGINDSADLPDEYLQGIFDEIAQNEIVLDTERANAANLGILPQQPSGLVNTLANVGRDLQREAYAQASEEMSNRTELLFKHLLKAQKRAGGGAAAAAKGRYLVASSYRHIGPMFEVTWMSFLTALSGAAQESQNVDTIRLCMEGQKLAIRIACLFDLEDPRQAFVSSLSRSTNLYNLSEMKAKNVEALRALIEIAYTEGNYLKESWRDVLTSVSQLDRFQLISSGVEEGAVPDVLRANGGSDGSQANGQGRRSTQIQRRPSGRNGNHGAYQADIAEDARSADMIRGVDRIFTNTANLSGTAIVDFVKALTQVSWQEIQSSGKSDTPRTYSLQKLVEISGYNMLRVKFEWTSIWKILGQHFIDVGCHNNTHVVFFALNSLRQLSMRFMEIEELPGFQFQKDFLKPFELILSNAQQSQVKDMVLRCLIQMIQARGDMIRSGWRTMFGVFTVAAREPYESIVNLAFDNVTQVYNERFGVVLSQSAFADMIVCLTEFSKNSKFQKKSLQAIETLRSTVPKMLRTPECPLSQKAPGLKDAPQAANIPKQPVRRTQEEQYWFPVLFAFHDVLMTGEDLEVRSRALNYLFDTLTNYGGEFPRDFWDVLWRQLLMPIFMVLRDRKSVNVEAANSEELSVWLSTTLIQALRNMISLFTHFFESLEYMLDRFLELLTLCICQENDTLARIGSNCLQQLILQNVKKFSPGHWEKIVAAFVDLFAKTEAKELFSAATSSTYNRDRDTSNGAHDVPKPTPRDLAMDDAASVMTANTNAFGVNGFDDERANGTERVPATPVPLSSDHDGERSPSPARRKVSLEDFSNTTPTRQAPVVVTAARRRYFNQIITKCVLQLLMIETVSELFNNDAVYASIPSHLLLGLMALLKKSYHFAKRFNEDRKLRANLFREGFMKQPPNLLKQESGSASVYVSILLRMYADTSSERAASRPETEHALIPLCKDIIASYIGLDDETQQRNIVTWRPVVIDVLEGVVAFPDAEFNKHVEEFAPLAVGLMARDMGGELQRVVMGVWQRVCETKLGIEMPEHILHAKEGGPSSPGGSVTRERPGVFGTRRGSRAYSLTSGR